MAVTLAWPLLPVVAVELLSAAEGARPRRGEGDTDAGHRVAVRVGHQGHHWAGEAPLTVADWPEPEDTVTDVGVPGLLVRLKLAGEAPAAEAVTM